MKIHHSLRINAPIVVILCAWALGMAGLMGMAASDARQRLTLQRLAPTSDYFVRPCGLISYNGLTKCNRWSLHVINRNTEPGDRTNLKFHRDPDVPDEFNAHPASYAGQDYDIGHEIPNADAGKDTEDTFTTANATPQTPALNRGPWRMLEEHVRSVAKTFGVKQVFIVDAPTWLPDGPRDVTRTVNGNRVVHRLEWVRVDVIGNDHIWVPTHCLKAILVEHTDGTLECHAWQLPNDDDVEGPLEVFAVTTDYAEGVIGLDLWPGIPGEKELEAVK